MCLIRKAESALDALAVLAIRNECRLFMTRHTDNISEEEQYRWWSTIKNISTAHLLVVEDNDVIVGYGLVNLDLYQNQAWLTGALTETYRRKGCGRKIFEHMIALSLKESCTPWLEVRVDNYPAYAMYSSMGFRTMDRTKDIVTMALYEGSDA
jgi:ribosomal protein S18 acetylase RimI-like enzyme